MTSSLARGTHLKLEGLTKSFGDRAVLQDIDLEINPGEFVAVVGRSGCGKSTLLRLITGLMEATAGNVVLDGQTSRTLNPDVRIMFQDARLLPWQKVLSNVELGLLSHTQGKHNQAKQVLTSVGLSNRANDWPEMLSGGQRQRVSLARALVSQPRLLLLDEPLGALDALTRIEMQQLLENLWQDQGFTALLITHDVEEAVVLADRVILIEEGQITLDIKVDLPRPRQRGNAVFAKLVEEIVGKVLGQASTESLQNAESLELATTSL